MPLIFYLDSLALIEAISFFALSQKRQSADEEKLTSAAEKGESIAETY